jgi:uncharacterized LabA/DUF88 family protein
MRNSTRSPRRPPTRPNTPTAPTRRLAPQPNQPAHVPAAHVAPVMGPPVTSPNAALLIDFDNVTMGIRSDLQSELKNLLGSDIIRGKVQLRRAYADWRRYPQYVAPLAESSIDMIMAPAYGSSKKNATDIRLAIDALELVFTRPEIGTYILLSGDSDFSTLVIKLKEYGKYVIGVGMRESSSDLLVMNCDEYYSYNALAGLVRAGSEEDDSAERRDPWELVTEAMARMQRNGDVMRADRLKQVMQDIDNTFDEKNLGMSKFSRFVQEAAHRGLVSLTKLENGQLEIGPPRAPGAGAAGNLAPVVSPADALDASATSIDSEGRPRRSRRGRGGRGRSRAVVRGGGGGGGDVHEEPIAATGEGEETGVVAAETAPPVAGPSVVRVGQRLTRDEAFALVRQATEALVRGAGGGGGANAIPASAVRAKAQELLGRDSDSLSEHNFARVLRDAHDADIIDLRRHGDDYEVAVPASVSPVSDQLNLAAAAHALPASRALPSATESASTATAHSPSPVPTGLRGMRPRGGGGRSPARRAAPPPELLSVGVVDTAPSRAVSTPASRPAESASENIGPAAPTEEEAVSKPARKRPTRSRAKRPRSAASKTTPAES